MKIATWNLAGRWDDRHAVLLADQDCDIWLLTEIREDVRPEDFDFVRTTVPMTRRRHWAAVLSRQPLQEQELELDLHPASAAARLDDVVYCSSVLPWRSCGSDEPWRGTSHEERTGDAVSRTMSGLPEGALVWGGDWNSSLSGPEHAGSKGGRRLIQEAIEARRLQVPTAGLPHHLEGVDLSIDHIAVPQSWTVLEAVVVTAAVGGTRLSDHDAYVIDVNPGRPRTPGQVCPLGETTGRSSAAIARAGEPQHPPPPAEAGGSSSAPSCSWKRAPSWRAGGPRVRRVGAGMDEARAPDENCRAWTAERR